MGSTWTLQSTLWPLWSHILHRTKQQHMGSTIDVAAANVWCSLAGQKRMFALYGHHGSWLEGYCVDYAINGQSDDLDTTEYEVQGTISSVRESRALFVFCEARYRFFCGRYCWVRCALCGNPACINTDCTTCALVREQAAQLAQTGATWLLMGLQTGLNRDIMRTIGLLLVAQFVHTMQN